MPLIFTDVQIDGQEQLDKVLNDCKIHLTLCQLFVGQLTMLPLESFLKALVSFLVDLHTLYS